MLTVRSIGVADVVEPAIAGDPLLRNIDLPLTRVFHPLGFSIKVVTNSEEILAAAQESWGDMVKVFPEPPLELRIALGDSRSGNRAPTPVYRAQRNLLTIVADARNFAVCDRDRGFAFAWVNRDALDPTSYLRYHFLESVALNLLSSLYVTPLHAACVEFAGKGVLFCGNSGAGKSSLAFACARAGWKYVSDDASYLLRGQSGRVVAGNSYHVRLRPSATDLFPEIEGFPVQPRAGKASIEIPTSLLPFVTTTTHTSVEYILFLNRTESAPELAPFPLDIARHWANQSPAATGDDGDDHAASVSSLLRAQLYELRYSDLPAAVKFLQSMIFEDRR